MVDKRKQDCPQADVKIASEMRRYRLSFVVAGAGGPSARLTQEEGPQLGLTGLLWFCRADLKKQPSYFNRTAHRTMQVLEELAHSEAGVSLQQLAERLDASKSSVFPIVRTLVEIGYVEAVAPAGYRLTDKSARLHGVHATQPVLIRALREALLMQSGLLSDTAFISVLRSSRVVCIAAEQDEERVASVGVAVGTVLPAHATASGKVLLSGLSNEAVHVLMRSQQLPRYTDKTMHNLADLIDELDLVRRRGWAESWEELDRGLAGVAVPIRSPSAGLVAALELMLPLHRAEPERWVAIRKQAVSLALEIGTQLGSPI